MIKETLSHWDFYYQESKKKISHVTLPHTPVEVDLDGNNHWQGVCYYRRSISVEKLPGNCIYKLYFGAAMHTAVVSIDGKAIALHEGGYLPFEIDVTSFLSDGLSHEVLVQLDNRDNPDMAPGKELKELDFCWYGGLYREVELRAYPLVHISDSVAAEEVAGGGIFISTLSLGDEEACVEAKIHLTNASGTAQTVLVLTQVLDGDECVFEAENTVRISASGKQHEIVKCLLNRPKLWDLDHPQLYKLRVTLQDAECGELWETREERFGVRCVEMSAGGGLRINGKRVRPRGTNRHQDHPWVGYAVPEKADRRDALRIKSAGFDYVRLSHYPQSPAFLDACDELGIVVMNCIPGWQFYGESKFEENCYSVARGLIRRDRNHPSIILWELSLNETPMPECFMQRMRAIGHEEYPGDQMFTCGWMDAYDVFIHSRQHEQIHTWKNGDKALVVAEYGDWEYYASNEGFDQKKGLGLLNPAKNSRVLRGDGEAAQKQQAANFTEALADTLACPAVTCGQWGMFDYPRGYEPHRATCGVMDVYRLPKYAFHFYRSQRSAAKLNDGSYRDVELFIASNWNDASPREVTVFTNAEKVDLYFDDTLLGRMKKRSVALLPHPPMDLLVDAYRPGRLKAVAYIADKVVAEHTVATAAKPAKLELLVDTQGVPVNEEQDLFFVHARVVDAAGNLCPQSNGLAVTLELPESLHCVCDLVRKTEAGIASFLIRKEAGITGDVSIKATASDLKSKAVCLW